MEMTVTVTSVKAALDAHIDAFNSLGARSFVDLSMIFTQRNGRDMRAAPYRLDNHTWRTPKECFRNAIHLALEEDLAYVEGYALRPNLPLLIHHAWCVGEAGEVIDPTWKDPEGGLYCGVEFDAEVARSRMWETQIYGLFYSPGFDLQWLSGFDPGMLEIVDRMHNDLPAFMREQGNQTEEGISNV